MTGQASTSERATCERCSTAIDSQRRSCPECGYEPAGGAAVVALALLATPVALLSLALLAGTVLPIGVVAGLPDSAATTAGVPGALVSGAVLYAYTRQDRRTPTDSTIF